MIDCTTCAQALPIATCASSVTVGVVDEAVTEALVRFTDRATGRVTVLEATQGSLPIIVVASPPDFVPGNSVKVEVLTVYSDGPGSPMEFFPYTIGIDLAPEALPYPATCVVFTAVKTFGTDGAPLSDPRILIIES
jgi:hypothetical protein